MNRKVREKRNNCMVMRTQSYESSFGVYSQGKGLSDITLITQAPCYYNKVLMQ